jgi:hypothetical protein
MKRSIFILAFVLILLASFVPVFGAQQSGGRVNPDIEKEKTVKAIEINFKDITGHWAEKVINKMASKGVIRGVGNNEFQPDRNMKRSEFAYLIDNAFGIQIAYFAVPDITKMFNDVKNEDWYSSALIDLVTAGIVDDKTAFRPNEPITREEMVHYIVRAFVYKTKTELGTQSEVASTFSDKDQINKAYLEDVNNAVKMGFIFGKGGNLFMPKGMSTRAEVSVVISRIPDSIAKAETGAGDEITTGVKVEPGFEKSSGAFKMKLVIKNNTDADVTINHSSSQKFNFVLMDSDRKELYCWSADKMFLQALTETVIAKGDSVEFSYEMDLKSYGEVIDKAVYLKAFIVGQSNFFKINQNGYELDLKVSEDLKRVP